MGGCQNYGPLWDPCYNPAPTVIFRYPKRDHNFDNHPDVISIELNMQRYGIFKSFRALFGLSEDLKLPTKPQEFEDCFGTSLWLCGNLGRFGGPVKLIYSCFIRVV